jgi:hypothetical protein
MSPFMLKLKFAGEMFVKDFATLVGPVVVEAKSMAKQHKVATAVVVICSFVAGCVLH